MALELFYITNNPEIAKIAENNDVNRIWVDLETRGKAVRQRGMNTVKSNHTMQDVSIVRSALKGKSKLMVRVNPLFEGSKKEIDEVISRGADVVMLPFFFSLEEAQKFIEIVDGRARTCLLVETLAAEKDLENIAANAGMDEIHIGLNDLHLQHNMKFMFELLSNGTVEKMSDILKKYGIPFGFGGIAKLDEGLLPARHVIGEHYRIGSSRAILSRSFFDSWIASDLEEIERTFKYGIGEIRNYEERLNKECDEFFETNRKKVIEEVELIKSKL